jgi:hypothetical protein
VPLAVYHLQPFRFTRHCNVRPFVAATALSHLIATRLCFSLLHHSLIVLIFGVSLF